MLELRPVRIQNSLRRIPVAATSIRGLIRILATSDSQSHDSLVAQFQDLLEIDPFLLIWSVIRSSFWNQRLPTSHAEIAAELADCSVSLLRDIRCTKSICFTPSTGDLACQILERSLRDQGRIAGMPQSPFVEEAARLYSIYRGLPQLLSSLPAVEDSIEEDLIAHRWLYDAEELDLRTSELPESLRSAVSALAVEEREPAWRPPDQASKLLDECRRQFAEDTQDWEEEITTLLRSMAQFRDLQSHFDLELERAKLLAMAELAYGAGHEINNPLANIASRAQQLLQNESDPERRRKLATINNQVFRAHEMIADLMLFAKPPRPRPSQFDIRQTISQILDELRSGESAIGIHLALAEFAENSLIEADESQVNVAIRALLNNSLTALQGSGTIYVELRRVCQSTKEQSAEALDSVEWIEIEVIDDGPGISPNVRPHIFDPYFSGREAGRGLGLGLSKCWRIVKQHGGEIEVTSTPNVRTSFLIRIPAMLTPTR